jgi:Uma2 family endonuclease
MTAISSTERTSATLSEQRVTLPNISWQTYQQILAETGECRRSRLTYDRGVLEIVVPLEPHERSNRTIEQFVIEAVEGLDLEVRLIGSTTLDRADLTRGAEPDSGYYIHRWPVVADRRIDLAQGPPPDLVVEVEMTHSDIDKLNLYAAMGIPEFWRYNGERLQILQLVEGQYVEVDISSMLSVEKVLFDRFMSIVEEEGLIAARRMLRSHLKARRDR